MDENQKNEGGSLLLPLLITLLVVVGVAEVGLLGYIGYMALSSQQGDQQRATQQEPVEQVGWGPDEQRHQQSAWLVHQAERAARLGQTTEPAEPSNTEQPQEQAPAETRPNSSPEPVAAASAPSQNSSGNSGSISNAQASSGTSSSRAASSQTSQKNQMQSSSGGSAKGRAPSKNLPDNTPVYVSDNAGKIHSKPNCSNMKYYTEMTLGEARVNSNFEYCQNCWN